MTRVVFVPGFGRDGAAAWPRQLAGDLGASVQVEHLAHAAPADQAAAALTSLGSGGGHLVAHSAGAVAATLAAASRPDLVRSLVLFEPACFTLARGGPEVERQVREMTPVYAVADDTGTSDEQVARLFLAALGADVPPAGTPGLAAFGARVRTTPPPWDHERDPSFLALVPTLVVTGGWSPLYEEVAAALVGAGATHARLEGCEHRPQDCDVAAAVLTAHWASA